MSNQSVKDIYLAADFVKDQLGLLQDKVPEIAVVLGSGLSPLASEVKKSNGTKSLSFKDIPSFCYSTVEGHKGEFIYGLIDEQVPVLFMNGRLHCYEGYSAAQVVFPIRTLGCLGIKNLVLTNASGAIGDGLEPGQLMVISDHLNLTGNSPLIGKNLDDLGPRFVDMSQAYCPKLRELLFRSASKLGLTLHQGVYAGLLGPTYETPAEIRMLKILGAHAVGMSTIYETIAARHMGINVLGICTLTNMAAGLSRKKISHAEVIEVNAQASKTLSRLLTMVIKDIC